jgi:hypothetical protein
MRESLVDTEANDNNYSATSENITQVWKITQSEILFIIFVYDTEALPSLLA